MTQIDEQSGEHIFTSKGYMPLSGLEHYVGWEDKPDYIKFTDVYKLNGEVVKESAHVYNRKGIDVFGEQVKM